jgi:hypothetical protein
VLCAVFSPEGERIVSASWDGTLKVWDVATGQESLTLRGHSSALASVAFSPDGRRLASVSEDCTVKLWDATTDPKWPGIGQDLVGWHRRESIEAEKDQRWFAAHFHLNRLLEAVPPDNKREQVILNKRIERAASQFGEKVDALDLVRRSIEIDEMRLADDPDNLKLQAALASASHQIGVCLVERKQVTDAIPY